MKFRTELKLSQAENVIDHSSKILLIGSCFSDHMSGKLSDSGFEILANPHGILFNPKSIENSINEYLRGESYSEQDLTFNGEQWVSLNHHGRFNDPNPAEILKRINNNIRQARNFLPQATHLILTLGTSWVYRHLEQDRLVANCHKIPQKEFQKELLAVEQIANCLEGILSGIRKVNAKAPVVFTVSPVRHLRDGMIENTLSKARLLQAIHKLVKEGKVHYFPSYEIMMDDLRDYRFYERDMIPPNRTAIEYIWEKFCEVWIDPSSKTLMDKVQKIHRSLEHRPLHSGSGQYRIFMQKVEEEMNELQKTYPGIKFIKKGSR